MAEERMLNDEILLGLIKANSGGGGGGTTDYSDLSNKPQINNVTLSGNKSASDLGLVASVDGKGLSTNDYTDADKAIVGGVTAALAGKQNVFTSGDYLEMSNGVLNVTKNKGNDLYSYKFITTSTSDQPRVKIQRYINGVFQSEETYNNDNVRVNPVTLDGLFTFTYGVDGYRWQYTLLANSHQHNAGEVVKWMYNVSVDSTESFDVVPQDTSKNLVLQEDLDAALADKQDKTDNSLQTTSKTVVGGINELKSGLTNLDNEVNGDATTYPYADVITIEDAVPANLADCSVKIEPVQDLHGYDHPWVGGAGANKLPVPYETASGSTINNMTITYDSVGVISLNGSANNDFIPIFDGTLSSDTYYLVSEQSTSLTRVTLNINGTVVTNQDYDDAPYQFTTDGTERIILYVKTISGTLTNAVVKPMITNTNVTAWQPYTNICPITGHTEASVQRDGKNLCNWKLNTYNDNPLVKTLWQGNYTLSTKTPSTNNNWYIKGIKPDGTFCSKSELGLSGFMDASESGLYYGNYNNDTLNFSVPSDGILVRIGRLGTDGTIPAQLEMGTVATDFEPYAGKTYTIALGSTIYGGTVDFDSGVMTVDRAFVDIGTLNWEYNAGTNAMSTELADVNLPTSDAVPVNAISSICRTISADDRAITTGIRMYVFANINVIYIRDSGYTDAIAFKNAMVGQQLCYELATPTTVQLTPQQIQLLKGTNTLTASTGQISVTVNGVSGAIGSLTSDKQDKTDYALNTTAKTVVGGINEVNGKLTSNTSNIFNTLYYLQFGDLIIVSGEIIGDGTSSIELGIPTCRGTLLVRNNANGEMSPYSVAPYSGITKITGWDGSSNREFTQDVPYSLQGVLYVSEQ